MIVNFTPLGNRFSFSITLITPLANATVEEVSFACATISTSLSGVHAFATWPKPKKK